VATEIVPKNSGGTLHVTPRSKNFSVLIDIVLHVVPSLRMRGSILHFPTRFHGMHSVI
jgi:hypothetical protein